MPSLWQALTRRKRNGPSPEGGAGDASQLARVLNLFDLTALGVGSTLGLGAYVLAGSVAYEQAGPAVTLSFLVAAVASSFAGICYAEFAARVPKAGSAYVYSYITIGEFVAFTIGWNLILEYVIGTSSVARGLSGYIDSLIDDRMATSLRSMFPIDIDFMASYPDFLSFVLVLLVAGLLSLGVKESSWMNIAFTAVNLSTIVVMIVAGSLRADTANWNIPKESIPDNVNGGQGGFMPFGVAGVMAGAAKCFYGFVGFDCVATTGEEAKNPQRNIPISIVLSLIIICLSYLGVSTVLTMMTPYYMLNATAPFPHVFQLIGWVEIKWIVTIGAIFALCTNLLGAMFPLPRVLYAMASDGILYRPLKRIHNRTQTPLLATVVAGLLSATMALVFDLHQLIDMMSIGTLIAYTIVAICVLVLRFECDAVSERLEAGRTLDDGWWPMMERLVNLTGVKQTSQLSARIAKVTIVAFSATAIVFCALVNVMTQAESDAGGGAVMGQLIGGALWSLGALMLLMVALIARQPVSSVQLMFRVPLVPWIPCLSVLINVYLMLQLDLQTWIRFGVWGAVGYFIYFTYGIRHSTEGVMVAKEKAAVNQRTEFYRINHITLKPTTVGGEHNGNY